MARPGLLAPPLPAPPPVPTTLLVLLLLLLLPRPHALSWPHTPPGPHAQVLGVQKEVLLWAQTSGWCAVAPLLRLSPFGQFDLKKQISVSHCEERAEKGPRQRSFAGTRCVDKSCSL
jgi:hypothetical protein